MSTDELVSSLESLDRTYRSTSRADESDIEGWLHMLSRWHRSPVGEGDGLPDAPTDTVLLAFHFVMEILTSHAMPPPEPGSHVWQLLRSHCKGCWLFRVRQSHYTAAEPFFEGMVGYLEHFDPYRIGCPRLEWRLNFGLILEEGHPKEVGWIPLHCLVPASFPELVALMEERPRWPDWSHLYGGRPKRESAPWRLAYGPEYAKRGDEFEAHHLASSQLDALEAAFAAVLAWLDEGLPAQEAVAEAAKVLSRALDAVVLHPPDTELVARYAAVGPGARRARKGAARIASFMRDGREDRVQRTLEGLRALREG